MLVEVNNIVYESLKEYISNLENNYGNEILKVPPKNKCFPHTLFRTITDIQTDNNCRGKKSTKGYRIDIFAQDRKGMLRVDIAEKIFEQINYFMCDIVGLEQQGYASFDVGNNSETTQITVTYVGTLDEFRVRFI